jgi:hypothetical protein
MTVNDYAILQLCSPINNVHAGIHQASIITSFLMHCWKAPRKNIFKMNTLITEYKS